jgi:FkbM family methyltransferase
VTQIQPIQFAAAAQADTNVVARKDGLLAGIRRQVLTAQGYRRAVGVRGLAAGIKGKITRTSTLQKIERPDLRFPFHLRVPSSDVPALEQIFVRQEYDFEVAKPPQTLVDAGANIGLASLYFANRFPRANIIAIEPEQSNFDLLSKNVAPYKTITAMRAALWHENGIINLVDPDLGKWGFMTQARDDVEEKFGAFLHEVRAITVDTLMKEHGIDHIDILKIDIEGAEREVFRDPSAWIGKVGALIVELHERMKPGCNSSFYNSTKGFDDEWFQGENVYLAKNDGCLTRHRDSAAKMLISEMR